MNIFEIDQHFSALLQEIEENGGEITEEQYEDLKISEQNLKEKLSAYKNVVLEAKGDIEKIKCESKRLSERKDVLNNRIDRLKSIMLDAVIKFGDEGKTNKFIELPDARLYTKETQSTNIFNDRISIFIYCLSKYISEGFTEHTAENILNYINECANLNFSYNKDEYFTLEDLNVIKLTVTKKYDVFELINSSIAKEIGTQVDGVKNYEIELGTPKDILKIHINAGEQITIGSVENNTSLIIK